MISVKSAVKGTVNSMLQKTWAFCQLDVKNSISGQVFFFPVVYTDCSQRDLAFLMHIRNHNPLFPLLSSLCQLMHTQSKILINCR